MSAPPRVAFIDGSVKPLVNDQDQVGHLVQLRPDAVSNRSAGRALSTRAVMVRAVHPEVAAIIRTELSDPEREPSTHTRAAIGRWAVSAAHDVTCGFSRDPPAKMPGEGRQTVTHSSGVYGVTVIDSLRIATANSGAVIWRQSGCKNRRCSRASITRG